MIFRQSPGPCKAASVGGLAYRHIGYFIPLFIGHRERKALIARFFCKLTGNLSGMSPRGFEVRVVLPLLLLLKRAVVFDVKEKSRHSTALSVFEHVSCPSCQPSPALRLANCESDIAISASQAIEGTVITAAAAPGWISWANLGSGTHAARALSASITRAGIW